MESKAVCPDRSWQSMKERFLKHVMVNLDKFKVTKTQLMKADKDKANAPTRKTATDQAGSSRRPFTRSEDEAILRHILTNEDYSRVGGNKMWTEMETVVGGRSWQSLKERFRTPPATRKVYWGRNGPSLEFIFFCRFLPRLSENNHSRVIFMAKFVWARSDFGQVILTQI